MKIEQGKIDGDARLTEDLELHGIITGSVVVGAAVTFRIHGIVGGDLTVEQNARVYLRGTLSGDLINNGGEVAVWGVVGGGIVARSGRTLIHRKAMVMGTVTGDTLPLLE